MKKFLLLIVLITSVNLVFSQAYTFTAGNKAYSENFDAMGTGTTHLSGWSGLRYAGSGLIGEVLPLVATDGSYSSGSVDNVGIAGTNLVTDRALGSLASGSTMPMYGTSFTNNTNEIIITIAINAFFEQWKSGSNATVNEKVKFEYSLNATSLNDAAATWVAVSTLDLNEILTTTTTAAKVDGNLPANRVAISATLTNQPWASGTNLWIRWSDKDDFGSDGIYAVDDLTINVTTGIPILLSSTPQKLTDFSYFDGSGPSEAKELLIGGSNLSGNVEIALPANYELSYSNNPFTAEAATLNIAPEMGILNKTIFARLKAGLAVGSYTEEVDLSSTGANTSKISFSGVVNPNTAPAVSNVSVPTTAPTSSETVAITASVTDAENNLTSVNLKWGTKTGEYTGGTIKMNLNVAKTTNSQYITETAIPAQVENTTVYYVVVATDAKSATTTSDEKSYTVAADANTAPEVTNVATNPTAPTSTQSVLVTATVSDAESNLASVNLKWGTATGSYTGGTIEMALNNAKVAPQYITKTAIPAQAANTMVYYVVVATDAKSATTTSTEQSYKVDPSTGVETAVANSIRLFPNPATSVLNVAGENIKFIALTNLAGQEIVTLSAVNNQTSIDVEGLEKGIYFVKVTTTEGAIFVNKFIKE